MVLLTNLRETGKIVVSHFKGVTMTKEKEFLTLEEAASQLGIKRATLYRRMDKLGIETTKFKGMDRKSYISSVQVKQIKDAQSMPWLATGKQGE